MSALIGVVGAILGFGLVVAFHELGHYLGGLLTNSTMKEFSVGMGPKIYGRMIGSTNFNIRLLPLGGFVRFASSEEDEMKGEVNEQGNYLEYKNPWQRILVSVLGPFFSLVLCPLCYLIVFTFAGLPSVTINGFEKGLPAAVSGLELGDKIVSINEENAYTGSFISGTIFNSKPGKPITLEIENKGGRKTISVTPIHKDDKGMIGVLLENKREPTSFKTACKESISITIANTKIMLGSLKQIFKGQAKSDDIAGPVGIMKLLNSQAKAGIFSLLSFLGFLSLNLAIMNMLPFPPLDGGNILCDSIEAVTTRKLPKMILIAVKTVFVLCLLAILVFTFFNDLSN